MNAKIAMVRRHGVETRRIECVATLLFEAPSAGELT